MLYERHHAWSVLLRLYHWSFAFSIVVLTTTGLYIHDPWTNTMLEGSQGFPMATMRYLHFIAGFVFTGALLARLYLLIFGNRWERIWNFLPITPKKIGNFFKTLLFYAYLTDRHQHRIGHNTLAGIAYVVTFLAAAVQLVSGFFMLYPESTFWQSWGMKLFPSQQQARFVHFLIMWYFLLFALTHIYIVIWNDVRTREGLISSMFNGRKYMPHKS